VSASSGVEVGEGVRRIKRGAVVGIALRSLSVRRLRVSLLGWVSNSCSICRFLRGECARAGRDGGVDRWGQPREVCVTPEAKIERADRCNDGASPYMTYSITKQAQGRNVLGGGAGA